MNAHEFLQAGSLNVRMGVEASVAIDDGCGGKHSAWVHQFDLWARIVPISGILTTRADDVRQNLTHWIYIRMNHLIKPGMRFAKGERQFQIRTVRDPDETGRYLICEVEEAA